MSLFSSQNLHIDQVDCLTLKACTKINWFYLKTSWKSKQFTALPNFSNIVSNRQNSVFEKCHQRHWIELLKGNKTENLNESQQHMSPITSTTFPLLPTFITKLKILQNPLLIWNEISAINDLKTCYFCMEICQCGEKQFHC